MFTYYSCIIYLLIIELLLLTHFCPPCSSQSKLKYIDQIMSFTIKPLNGFPLV